MKIIKIEEKVLQPSKLEDGVYTGLWGSDIITITHNNRLYQLTTDVGVRGFNIKVSVHVKGDTLEAYEIKN